MTIGLTDLPETMRRPVSGSDRTALIRELANRGSLTLDGTTVIVALQTQLTGVRSLALHTLRLLNGARLITNGVDFDLTVAKLEINGGSILTFESKASPPPASARSPGLPGRSGGRVYVSVAQSIAGRLDIDLRGQDGGAGGVGAPGAPGQVGARGADAVAGLFDCRSGGQNGGKGGDGQQGEQGAPGGTGGDGGSLTLSGVLGDSDRIVFRAEGGHGGAGGLGGEGGPGGPGGQGGSGGGLCGGGHPGPLGSLGPQGPPGVGGPSGRPGGRIISTSSRTAVRQP